MAELWPGGPIELPLTLRLDDEDLTIPAVPTLELLHILATRSWWQLVPNQLPMGQLALVVRRLHDEHDTLDMEDLWHPTVEIMTRLTGMTDKQGTLNPWPGIRLAASAVVQWPLFIGWCATHGLDPASAPLWRVMGGIYAWLKESMSGKDLVKLEQEIWAPPPYVATGSTDALPQHIRDADAALALAALREAQRAGEGLDEWQATPAS